MEMYNSKFSHNTAGSNIGAIGAVVSTLIADNIDLEDNVAGGLGAGAVVYLGDFSLTNSRFKSNRAGTNGGGMWIAQKGLTKPPLIRNVVFDNTVAGNSGGALSLVQGTNVHIEDVTITNCHAVSPQGSNVGPVLLFCCRRRRR